MLHEMPGAYYSKDVKNCHNGKTLSFAKLQLPISYHSQSCWYLGSFYEIALYVLHNYPKVLNNVLFSFLQFVTEKTEAKLQNLTPRTEFHFISHV